jgi:hypothetical protein
MKKKFAFILNIAFFALFIVPAYAQTSNNCEVYYSEKVGVSSCHSRDAMYKQLREDEKKFVPIYIKDKNQLLGLAFSGGGIRSNAFHLGLLSGLKRNEIQKSNDLKKGKLLSLKSVGYISAVSGGSWAAGGFTAAPDEINYFKELEKIIISKTNTLENKGIRQYLFNSYTDTIREIEKANRITDPFNLYVGYSANDAWRDMILKNVLIDNDFRLSNLQKSTSKKDDKPYLIINGTHDARSFNGGKNNFPVEFTSQHMVIAADCGSIEYCSFKDDYKGLFIYGERFKDLNLSFSQTLAISSGVLPPSVIGIELRLLEWAMTIDKDKKEEKMFRDTFILTDGGHSENLGALPLIGRNVDYIIISDIDYDPGYTFDDFQALKYHADNLLKKKIVINENIEFIAEDFQGNPDNFYNKIKGSVLGSVISGLFEDKLSSLNSLLREPGLYDKFTKNNNNAEDDFKKIDQIDDLIRLTNAYRDKDYDINLNDQQRRNIRTLNRFILEYIANEKLAINKAKYNINLNYICGSYKDKKDKDGTDKKKIIYIKAQPSIKLTKGFRKYLTRDNDYLDVYNYLLYGNNDVPCDKTMAFAYEPKLIKAYYILGQYLAENLYLDEICSACDQLLD